jgi:hypothetical protein
MCPSNEEEQRNLWMRFRMLTALSTHGFTYSWPPNTHACVLDHLKLRTLKNSFLSEKRNRYCKDKIPPRRTHLSVDFFPFSPLLCLFFPFPTSHLISYISFELFFDGVSVSHSSPQLTWQNWICVCSSSEAFVPWLSIGTPRITDSGTIKTANYTVQIKCNAEQGIQEPLRLLTIQNEAVLVMVCLRLLM